MEPTSFLLEPLHHLSRCGMVYAEHHIRAIAVCDFDYPANRVGDGLAAGKVLCALVLGLCIYELVVWVYIHHQV